MEGTLIGFTDEERRTFFRHAVPAACALAAVACHELVDVYYISRHVGRAALSSLAAMAPLHLSTLAGALLVAVGAAVVVARDQQQIRFVLSRTVLWSIFVGVGAALVASLGASTIVASFGLTGQAALRAIRYVQGQAVGLFALPFCVLAGAVVRASGKGALLTRLLGASLLLKLVSTHVFVVFGAWGCAGVAWANSLARLVVALSFLWYLWQTVGPMTCTMDLPFLRQSMTIGCSAAVSQGATALAAAMVAKTVLAWGGVTALAAWGAVVKVLVLLMLPLVGVAQGLTPLVAQAGYVDGFVGSAQRYALGAGLMAMVLGLCAATVVPLGSQPLLIVSFAMPFVAVARVGLLAFQGKELPWQALAIPIVRRLVFLPLCLFILPQVGDLRLTGVWLALPVSEIATALWTWWLIHRTIVAERAQRTRSARTQ